MPDGSFARSALSVSYTHLVELLHTETGQTERLNVDGLFIAVGQAPQSAPFLDAIAAEDGYYPVSYTHLDVYKRQGLTSRA